jgi:uncharacterized membrane protein
MTGLMAVTAVLLWKLNVMFPGNGAANEQIVLRWIHIVFGTMWIGFIYFLNLVTAPTMEKLDAQTRGKVFPLVAPKVGMWIGISSGITWLAGFRYFMIFAKTDAANIGDPGLAWKWIGFWLVCWLVAALLLILLVRPTISLLNNTWVLVLLALIIVSVTAWFVLGFLSHPEVSNRTLCIGVGGGIGTVMFVMGIVIGRSYRKLVGMMAVAAERGGAMHPDAAMLQRKAFLLGRIGFWLSFPMLFFMAASAHFPFLLGT